MGRKLLFIILLFLTASTVFGADTDIFAFAKTISGKVIWDSRTGSGQLSTSRYVYNFIPGVPWVVTDKGDKIGQDAIYLKDGMIMIPDPLAKAISSYQRASVKKDTSGHRVAAIFIDPGHGGKDPGAIGTHKKNGKTFRVMEKSAVLDVGKNLRAKLATTYPDKKILMSRTGDTYPTLDERVKMANRVKLGSNETILFVSIHANASLKPQANGFEVWYLPQEYRRTVVDSQSIDSNNKNLLSAVNTITEEELSMESELLAKSVMTGMKDKIGKDIPCRGIKQESWFVVRNTKMPAILIEIGFVTNPKEGELLSSSSYLQKISEGIYNGIKDFVYAFEHSGKK
ncbi:MAG: N-acetylmuramoyl-L-alanine amidase [Spirochaetia bacterium]|nr:N-acetylmuramoyl-L-alanine amidase [Spirochaetia bacterium]